MASRATQLLARPSKEWVIPPKAKPGRKPKIEESSKLSLDQGDKDNTQEKKQLNRAAQRAFRERKQSQLAELHARIQAYEQGEVERNVALQNVGKRLKEENDRLKKENSELKDNVARLKARLADLDGESTQTMEDSEGESSDLPAKKRPRLSPLDTKSNVRMSSQDTMSAFEPTPTSFQPTPSSPDVSSMSPMMPMNTNSFTNATLSTTSGSYRSGAMESPVMYKPSVMEDDSCGFCSETMPCLCRDASVDADVNRSVSLDTADDSGPGPSSSLFNSLPPYEPPVPIRLRSDRARPVAAGTWFVDKPVLNMQPPALPPPPDSSCSGDPNNCSACANDQFGRDFCTSLQSAVCSKNPCSGCPSRSSQMSGASSSPILCCGDPGLCGSLCSPVRQTATDTVMGISGSSAAVPEDMMRCDEAWRALKAHPHIPFAHVDLLAGIIANHTKCKASEMETVLASPASNSWAYGRQLVPQETLIRAGWKRRLAVDPRGVHEALRELDRGFVKFSSHMSN